MLYKDVEDKLKAGDAVFICDYRYNDLDNKAIRHVKPQKVVVFSNADLPSNKRVYYSDFHFRPIGKNGKPTSAVIAPYDNTGYRAYTGVSLNIFFDENECIEHYNKQCREIIEEFEEAKKSKLRYYDYQIERIEQEIVQQ